VEAVWDKTTQKTSLKTTPGISSFNSNLAGLQQSLAPLIDFAERNVPQELQSSTKVYMFATAGMRNLPSADQDKVMSRAASLLSASAFAFDPSDVAIITGQAEGYYGWVAANFLSGTFSSSSAGTVGVGSLDLGGASTQVAGAVAVCSGDKCDEADDSAIVEGAVPPAQVPGLMHVRFNSRRYSLFSSSFLGYGSNDFATDVKRRLYADNVTANPCYLLETPNQYTALELANNSTVNLPGSSEFYACLAETNAAFLVPAPTECYKQQGGACNGIDPAVCQCCIDGAARPTFLNSTFVGMGGFSVVLNGNLKIPAVGATRDFMFRTVADFCSNNFAQAKQGVPIPEQFLATTCATATEAIALLDLYGIAEYQIDLGSTIRGIEVTWALGAMISHANMIPVVRPPTVVGTVPL
jgi:hypothetical protein